MNFIIFRMYTFCTPKKMSLSKIYHENPNIKKLNELMNTNTVKKKLKKVVKIYQKNCQSLFFQKQTSTIYCIVNSTFFFFLIFITSFVHVILDCLLCTFVYTYFVNKYQWTGLEWIKNSKIETKYAGKFGMSYCKTSVSSLISQSHKICFFFVIIANIFLRISCSCYILLSAFTKL